MFRFIVWTIAQTSWHLSENNSSSLSSLCITKSQQKSRNIILAWDNSLNPCERYLRSQVLREQFLQRRRSTPRSQGILLPLNFNLKEVTQSDSGLYRLWTSKTITLRSASPLYLTSLPVSIILVVIIAYQSSFFTRNHVSALLGPCGYLWCADSTFSS